MTTHCKILAWEIPSTEEPGGLESMVYKRVRHILTTIQQQQQQSGSESSSQPLYVILTK